MNDLPRYVLRVEIPNLNEDDPLRIDLEGAPRRWVVTGCAGFIGSHVLETLISCGQDVTGIDNFSTGRQSNLDELQTQFGSSAYESRFRLITGDIRNFDTCKNAFADADVVVHLAALGSVPRSVANPQASCDVNVMGFLNVLIAAKDVGVRRVLFASSSSVYGNDDHPTKLNGRFGNVLSPYAASKRANELLGEAFANSYRQEVIGLRFFNVFGARQNPQGPYAAVIPLWTSTLLSGERCSINGDGQTARDFTHVSNVVRAILLAAKTTNPDAFGKTLNIACGKSTTLTDLFSKITSFLGRRNPDTRVREAAYLPFRLGDLRHSLADIDQTRALIGFEPLVEIDEGLERSLPYYCDVHARQASTLPVSSGVAHA